MTTRMSEPKLAALCNTVSIALTDWNEFEVAESLTPEQQILLSLTINNLMSLSKLIVGAGIPDSTEMSRFDRDGAGGFKWSTRD